MYNCVSMHSVQAMQDTQHVSRNSTRLALAEVAVVIALLVAHFTFA